MELNYFAMSAHGKNTFVFGIETAGSPQVRICGGICVRVCFFCVVVVAGLVL